MKGANCDQVEKLLYLKATTAHCRASDSFCQLSSRLFRPPESLNRALICCISKMTFLCCRFLPGGCGKWHPELFPHLILLIELPCAPESVFLRSSVEAPFWGIHLYSEAVCRFARFSLERLNVWLWSELPTVIGLIESVIYLLFALNYRLHQLLSHCGSRLAVRQRASTYCIQTAATHISKYQK